MRPFALRTVVRVLPAVLAMAAAGCGDDHASQDGETTSEVTLRLHTESQSREPPVQQPMPDTELRLGDERPVAAQDPPPARGKCDPNYVPCVPIDSDVDCAGGSGNGPSYVQGPVHVIGRDIYGLDRDGDGIGCDR